MDLCRVQQQSIFSHSNLPKPQHLKDTYKTRFYRRFSVCLYSSFPSHLTSQRKSTARWHLSATHPHKARPDYTNQKIEIPPPFLPLVQYSLRYHVLRLLQSKESSFLPIFFQRLHAQSTTSGNHQPSDQYQPALLPDTPLGNILQRPHRFDRQRDWNCH